MADESPLLDLQYIITGDTDQEVRANETFNRIELFEEVPEDPGKELRITLVGPLTNFAIGIPLFFLAPFIPDLVPMLGSFVHRLGILNLLVGGFNLFIPAFPMDGGRILRALLVPRLGRMRATRVASTFGQVIALMFGFLGFLTFASGGWLLILVAVFVFMGARGEEGATFVAESLAHYHVGDIMTRDVITLPTDATVEDALERMQRTRHLAIPLVNPDATVAGVVDLSKLRDVPELQRAWTRVGDHVRADPPRALATDSAQELARLMTGGAAPVLVFDASDALVGIVTPTDVARFTEVSTVRRSGTGPTGRW